MIRFNFYLQSILCGVAVIFGIATAIEPRDAIYYLLYYQLLVGVVQLIACLSMLILPRLRTNLLLAYILLTILFLSMVFMGIQLIRPLFFIFPWGLALLFWYISYKAYKPTVQ